MKKILFTLLLSACSFLAFSQKVPFQSNIAMYGSLELVERPSLPLNPGPLELVHHNDTLRIFKNGSWHPLFPQRGTSDTIAVQYLTNMVKFVGGGYLKYFSSSAIELSPNGSSDAYIRLAENVGTGTTLVGLQTLLFSQPGDLYAAYQDNLRGYIDDTTKAHMDVSTWALSARATEILIRHLINTLASPGADPHVTDSTIYLYSPRLNYEVHKYGHNWSNSYLTWSLQNEEFNIADTTKTYLNLGVPSGQTYFHWNAQGLRISRGITMGYSTVNRPGTIRYNSSTGKFEGRNGTDWAVFEVGTTGSYVPLTRTVNGKALSSDISITAADVGLGNVTNESKATMFTSPTITGSPTIAGYVPITRTIAGKNLASNIVLEPVDVSLGNVTNESKATMFTNPTFTGNVTASGLATGQTETVGINSTGRLVVQKQYIPVQVTCTNDTTSKSPNTTGGIVFIPDYLHNFNLVTVSAQYGNSAGTMTPTITVWRRRGANEANMTSVGANFTTNATINTSNDDVQFRDRLEVRWTLSGSKPAPDKILVNLLFERP